MICTFTVPPPPMRGRARCYVPPLPEFPEGVWERNGVLMYTCISCQRAAVLHCELDEYDPEFAYCGGSPWCLP